MIARTPKKKIASTPQPQLPHFSKVANDNQPPRRPYVGWVLFIIGVALLIGAFL